MSVILLQRTVTIKNESVVQAFDCIKQSKSHFSHIAKQFQKIDFYLYRSQPKTNHKSDNPGPPGVGEKEGLSEGRMI